MANQSTQGGTHEQHVKAGQQSHKNTPSEAMSERDGDHGAASGAKGQKSAETSHTQGGTHEQHVKAGQQSHKKS